MAVSTCVETVCVAVTLAFTLRLTRRSVIPRTVVERVPNTALPVSTSETCLVANFCKIEEKLFECVSEGFVVHVVVGMVGILQRTSGNIKPDIFY